MSGYDSDTKISFLTLAIGEEYVEKSLMLVQSVMKFTTSTLYMVTDCVELAEKHKSYFGEKLVIVDINNYKNFVSKIDGKFNYHLKAISIEMVSKITNNVMLYIDADTFVFGWDKSISRYLQGFDNVIMARFRELVSDNTSLSKFIPTKAALYDIDYKIINIPLAVETIMVITRGDLTNTFLKKWFDISDFAIVNSYDPFIEAFELALAINETQMNFLNVNNKTPFADSFRTLHNGKIISTNII